MPTETILLRTHRRAWALDQQELAALIGIASASHISRVECLKATPGLKFVLASEIVFGAHPKKLFPALFNDLEEEVVRNLFNFGERLKQDTSMAAARKRQLVDEALQRAARIAE